MEENTAVTSSASTTCICIAAQGKRPWSTIERCHSSSLISRSVETPTASGTAVVLPWKELII